MRDSLTSRQPDCITKQEQQNVLNLLNVCFAKGSEENLILEAIESLIYDVGKEFLPINFKNVSLEKRFLIKSGTKNGSTSISKCLGVLCGEIVIGYCLVLRRNNTDFSTEEVKNVKSNPLSNVLILIIGEEEVRIQLRKGKQKMESRFRKYIRPWDLENTHVLTNIRSFVHKNQNIKCSPQQLADNLASKAMLCKSVVERELLHESKTYKIKIKENKISECNLISELRSGKSSIFWENFPLLKLYFTFHTHLMTMELSNSDRNRKEGFLTFSDIYAQTISYGLLAARWMSKDKKNPFVRQNIRYLLPSSSEFLKNIFVELIQVNAGNELVFCINELFSTLYQVNIATVFEKEDPVIHFYEDFLNAYGKDIKRTRGVYYTPNEVVDFIIRSTDEQLKYKFGLPLGLASTKTWKEVLASMNEDRDESSKCRLPTLVKDTDVFVRILDPAAGTGTFMKCVLERIRNNLKEHWRSLGWSLVQMQAEWKAYVSGTQGVEKDYTGQGLLHRLNAFELMTAPYIITHLRIGLFFQEDEELPFEFGEGDRLNVFLTNSLEHPNDRVLNVCSDAISRESRNADVIKRDTAITVVLGNPPYNGESKEKGAEIMRLMGDYKREPKGGGKLKERNTKWINDDYVKFIRLSQQYITTSQIGIISFITPHGFIENPTFRGMRWHLLSVFDSIYILDLHGNIRKKEDDENIFTIQQGVSINLFSLHKQESCLGDTYYSEIRGKASEKLHVLSRATMGDMNWNTISHETNTKSLLFRPIDTSNVVEYTGFKLDDFFSVYSLGTLSKNDSVTISYTKEKIKETVRNFKTMESLRLRERYSLKNDSRDWKLHRAIEDIRLNHDEDNFSMIEYRPFDCRWTYFTGKKGFFAYSQEKVMKHLKGRDNIALVVGRQGQVVGTMSWNVVFITKNISDQNIFYRGGGTVFPAVLYIDDTIQANFSELEFNRISFFDSENAIESSEQKRARIFEVVYYIYAVLYSVRYREKFVGYLDIDFPRIPYPKNVRIFQQMAKKGKELCHLHVLESDIFKNLSSRLRNKDRSIATTSQEITVLRPNGSIIKEPEKVEGWNGQIWINNAQYFEGVSESVWKFYIGGYQPAQKWLKDRKKRSLIEDEVIHYSKILKAIEETNRIMKEIDQIDFL